MGLNKYMEIKINRFAHYVPISKHRHSRGMTDGEGVTDSRFSGHTCLRRLYSSARFYLGKGADVLKIF